MATTISGRLGAERQGTLKQIDTYFKVAKGRLKIREINGTESELIFYRREDLKGTRYSDYSIVPLEEAEPMKEVCRKIFGVRVVVKKKRLLFLYQNARIHVDEVDRLGTFVEFEVIVNRGRNQARRLMSFLVAEFEITAGAMIGKSYSDLILRSRKARSKINLHEKGLAERK